MSRLDQAVDLLRAGRLVAFPTETVYGLGANALNRAAVGRIFEAKGRPLTSPLIVHVDCVVAARGLAATWPQAAENLARKFWPGPLTIVVLKQPSIVDSVTAGLQSVAIRIPAHPLALELLQAVGLPIAAPSANKFTHLSPTTAEHVRASLGSAVDLILDGGPCAVGIESTVVSLTGPRPRILRPGAITQPQIEAAIGAVETGSGEESPGQHPKHYSPRTPLVLGDSPPTGNGTRLDSTNMPSDAAAYAERLYRVLHLLDCGNYDWISVEPPPDTPEWAGVRDRLARAAFKPEG